MSEIVLKVLMHSVKYMDPDKLIPLRPMKLVLRYG